MTQPWPIDQAVLDAVVAHRTPLLDALTLTLGTVGTSVLGMGLAGLVALPVLARLRAWREGLAIVIALVLGDVVAAVLKEWFAHPRPVGALQLLDGSGYAFPSSHATFTSAAAAALVCATSWRSRRARREAIAVLAALVAVVGASMIYLGAHWLSDVVAGWVLGTALGALVGTVTRRILPPRQDPPRPDRPERSAGEA